MTRFTRTSLENIDACSIDDIWSGAPDDRRSLSDLWSGETRFDKLLRAPLGYEAVSGRITRMQNSLRTGAVWPGDLEDENEGKTNIASARRGRGISMEHDCIRLEADMVAFVPIDDGHTPRGETFARGLTLAFLLPRLSPAAGVVIIACGR